jgi:hypothetical protein
VASIRYDHAVATVTMADGTPAGRIMTPGFTLGLRVDNGKYEAWTARHTVAAPGDYMLAGDLSWDEAVSLVVTRHEDAVALAAEQATRSPFSRGDLRLGQWSFWAPGYGDEDLLPAARLVGKVVNIGTKDGIVYDAVTVTAFDDRKGILTVEGGQRGSAIRGGAEPLAGPEEVTIWDTARGYIHLEAPRA